MLHLLVPRQRQHRAPSAIAAAATRHCHARPCCVATGVAWPSSTLARYFLEALYKTPTTTVALSLLCVSHYTTTQQKRRHTKQPKRVGLATKALVERCGSKRSIVHNTPNSCGPIRLLTLDQSQKYLVEIGNICELQNI